MTYADAADYFSAMRGRDEIINSPGGLLDKARRLANWQQAADTQAPAPRKWTVGDVLHGAIGAALGQGYAKGISSALGLGDRMSDKLETAALGIGAAMNTGLIKRSLNKQAEIDQRFEAGPKMLQQRKHAFRLGFMKAVKDLKVMDAPQSEKTAGMMPLPIFNLNPASLLAIPRGIAGAVTGGGRLVGNIAGTADAPDEDEEEITNLQVQKALLEEQLERLSADQQNKKLRKVLAKPRR